MPGDCGCCCCCFGDVSVGRSGGLRLFKLSRFVTRLGWGMGASSVSTLSRSANASPRRILPELSTRFGKEVAERGGKGGGDVGDGGSGAWAEEDDMGLLGILAAPKKRLDNFGFDKIPCE